MFDELNRCQRLLSLWNVVVMHFGQRLVLLGRGQVGGVALPLPLLFDVLVLLLDGIPFTSGQLVASETWVDGNLTTWAQFEIGVGTLRCVIILEVVLQLSTLKRA